MWKMNKELKSKYEQIKKNYNYRNLFIYENWIIEFTKKKEKQMLWQYLFYEVKPFLEKLSPEDAQIVREYFRQIYKSVLGDTNLITSGFKITRN